MTGWRIISEHDEFMSGFTTKDKKKFVAEIKKQYPDLKKIPPMLDEDSYWQIGKKLNATQEELSLQEIIETKNLGPLQEKAKRIITHKDLHTRWKNMRIDYIRFG